MPSKIKKMKKDLYTLNFKSKGKRMVRKANKRINVKNRLKY